MRFSISLCLVFLLSFSVSAQDDISSKAIDTNQDNKVDRVENFKNGMLISVARSTKYNDKFDETSYYFPYESPVKPTEVIEKDTDGDGKVDRIEKVYRNPTADLMIKTIKVIAKRSPASDKIWTIHSKLSQLAKEQDQANCLGDLHLEDLAIMSLASDMSTVRYSLDNGFYKTGWGYNIHQSCLDKWGATEFPNLLKTAMTTGLQCLEKLAVKSPIPNGAYRNAKELEHLLSSKPITITCNEKNYKWETTTAHASSNSTYEIKESKIKHPFISINPKYPEKKLNATAEELKDFQGILFHEQFHNTGLRHGDGVEYAYSCAECCVIEGSQEKKENACKLCAGEYTSATDKKYILDVLAWGNTSHQTDQVKMAIINYIKEFPDDRFGMLVYADAAADRFDPIGSELGKILKEKFSNLTPEEENFLKNSQRRDGEYKEVQAYSKLLASTHFDLYYEKKADKVVDVLEKELPKIKEMFELGKIAKGSDVFIYENLKETIVGQLNDIQLSRYPENVDSKTSKRAQALLKKLKVI